jgi:hypothetical protein
MLYFPILIGTSGISHVISRCNLAFQPIIVQTFFPLEERYDRPKSGGGALEQIKVGASMMSAIGK